MSPEYAMRGQYSMKSDVYSFGVLVLEIISGKKNSSFFGTEGARDLVTYVSFKFYICPFLMFYAVFLSYI